jgi:hypothetical protein
MATAKLVELDKEALFRALAYEPHEGQWAVHRSKAKRRVWIAGVRTGKSLAAAHEALAAAMEPNKRSVGWIVAPTLDLSEKVFREVVIVAAEKLRHRIIELKQHEKRLLLRNLGGGVSELRGKTSDNPTSLLGEGLSWLIVDECARMRPAIWASYLSQRLIDKDGWALFITTPRGRGWLWDLWKRGQPGGDPDYESWTMPSWANPHLRRELIEAERERLPDAVFRQEYGAEWIEGAGTVLRYVRESATGTWQAPVAGEEYFAGLDLAKVADFTALTIMNERHEVVFVDRFNKLDWGLQVARIKTATANYNNAWTFVDSTGAGEPVYEALCAAGVRAEGYVLTSASKNTIVTNLAMLFEKRAIKLPRYELCPTLIDELEGFEYTVTDAGTVKTGAPSGQHDDHVVSLALAAWAIESAPDFSVYELDRETGLISRAAAD